MGCADIGPVRLVGMSPIEKQKGVIDMMAYRSKEDDELGDMNENLQRFSVGIPDVTTDDLPKHYQCHTTGVLGQFARLLCRVAQVVMCYHEQHHDD